MPEKKKQRLPKWFNGELYARGETVTNPFSGESFELTAIELAMYDFIMGSLHVFEMAPKSATQKQINDFQKALTWFRINNPEAYMALLD